jgi:putative endonuclease
MSFFVYMLECANGHYYTGWSTDPLRRLKAHNRGKGARFTRMHGPCRLVYAEEMPDHSATLKREIQIKQLSHPQKAKLIENETLNCLNRLSAEEGKKETAADESLLDPSRADDQQNDAKEDQSQDAQGKKFRFTRKNALKET